jgi:hypothetical protein
VPLVDDADVQRIADVILANQERIVVSDAEIAKLAHCMAVLYGKANGTTAGWGRELARKVQRKVEFGRMAWRPRW